MIKSVLPGSPSIYSKKNLSVDAYEEQLEEQLSMIDAAKTTLYKLSVDEEVALVQIDAMKEEINLIVSV